MAEENGNGNGNGSRLRDPTYRERFLNYLDEPDGFSTINTGTPDGEPMNTDGGAFSQGAGGTEYTPHDTGIRESILRMASSEFDKDLATVQDRAQRMRQTRSGITSQRELDAARIAQERRIGMLGEFETGERRHRRDSLAKLALQEMAGEQAIGQIAATGTEERRTQGPRLLFERQKETGQVTGSELLTYEDVVAAGLDEVGNFKTAQFRATVGADRLNELAVQFTDEHGNMDTQGFADAFNAELFRYSQENPNEFRSAFGVDTEATDTLGFKRVEQDERYLRLAERAAIFNEEFVKAQITGIWNEYGMEEFGAFGDVYGLTQDDEAFNDRYDMDGDGDIDFSDFMEFSKAARAGGVETLAARQLREDTRQFNVTTALGAKQFDDHLDAVAVENNLSRNAERWLTLHALKSNEHIAQEGLDVERMARVVDLLGGEGVDELTSNEVDALVAIIMDEADVTDDALAAFNLSTQNRINATNMESMFDEYQIDGDPDGVGFMGVSGVSSIYDWFDVAEAEIGNLKNSVERDQWLAFGDVDGDGDITPMDRFFYTMFTS